MAQAQVHYGRRDPNERGCRTCRYWDGDRSWPTDETRTGRCSLPLPPYLLRALEAEPVTKATEDCRFHDYRPSSW